LSASLNWLHSESEFTANYTVPVDAARQFEPGPVHVAPHALTPEEKLHHLEQQVLDLQLAAQRRAMLIPHIIAQEQLIFACLVRISESEQPGAVPKDWNYMYPIEDYRLVNLSVLAEMVADPKNNPALVFIEALRTRTPPSDTGARHPMYGHLA
jgi:hypothetical protein